MADNTTELQKLYVAFYNRPADWGGLQFWLNDLNAGRTTLANIARDFAKDTEYRTEYAGMTNAQIVDKIYQNK